MSTEPKPYTDLLAQIAQDVQRDITGEAGGTTPPAPPAPSAPAPQPAAVAPAPAPAPTAESEKLIANKFRSVEEMEKAHHVLMHNFNALKAENDRLLARVATPEQPAPTPLSPGRVDPSKPIDRSDPEYVKWTEQYGIDPNDIDARIERKFREAQEAAAGPARAMQAADAYMLERYPEFPVKVEEVKAFVLATPALKERVAALWANNLFAEAMEIGYLAYDNALRTTQIVQGLNEQTTKQVDGDRGHATMLTSQAGGAREVQPNPNAYPRTEEDWARIRELRRTGRDAEANRIVYGPLIAHIPELNPRV